MEEEKREVEFDLSNDNAASNKDEVKSNFFKLTGSLGSFIKEVTNIREETDVEGSIDEIKADIDFKGHSVWILVFSIFIASIGLNVNSTAVVIGAMLISPLMGPILGIGLSVGINDWSTLLRSLKSLGIAVGASILASSLYFWLTPLHEASSELLARIKPTPLDALVAFFGGMALIVARTKKGTIASVIFGVAIATALMPPLCTAGYGLANGNWNFFFGAFYLFFLNSLFISLATILVVRFLRFPIVHLVDANKERKAKTYMFIFVVLVLVPSGIIFWDSIKESIFNQKANVFVSENFVFDKSKTRLNIQKVTYSDTLGLIEVSLSGEQISEDQIAYLQERMKFYELNKVLLADNAIRNVQLKVYQEKDNSKEFEKLWEEQRKNTTEYMQDQLAKNMEIINEKNIKIRNLYQEIDQLKGDSIPIEKINRELRLQYDAIDKVSFGRIAVPTNTQIDTFTTAFVDWSRNSNSVNWSINNVRLTEWLKVRLDLDTIIVISRQNE